MSPLSPIASALALLLLSCASSERGGEIVAGRTTIFPPVLYPGPNWISISDTTGIAEVRVTFEDSVLYKTTRVEGAGSIDECPTTHDLGVHLPAGITGRVVTLGITIARCDGTLERRFITLNTVWNVDVISFPEVAPGEEACRTFQIGVPGPVDRDAPEEGSVAVSSITSPDSRITFNYPRPLPVRIARGTSYSYRVCFTSDTAGTFRLPVVTWIRRDYPHMGLTSYPVADTALIVVSERTVEK